MDIKRRKFLRLGLGVMGLMIVAQSRWLERLLQMFYPNYSFRPHRRRSQIPPAKFWCESDVRSIGPWLG